MANASEIMQKKVITLDIKKGLKGVVDIIVSTDADYVIILDKNKPVGIITEKDILKRLLSATSKLPNIKLETLMTKDLISVEPTAGIEDISSIMEKENIRHVPVVSGDMLHGVVKANDVIKHTKEIQWANVRFNKYQNFQTAIIVIFFLFLISYFYYALFM